jgi:ACS family sodium-dependent inorganic phosphate cotransporter
MKSQVNSLWQFDQPQYQQAIRRSAGASAATTAAAAAAAAGKAGRRWAPRSQIVLACFLATLTAYVERTGFSIAYTEMAKEAGVGEAEQGAVLSAFFWGYAVSQIPGGWAAQRFGGDGMLTLSFLAWSLASLLTPGSAACTRAIVAARVGVGVAQGFLIPAVHTVLSRWIPPAGRARAVSLTTSGMYLGSAAAMQVLPAAARAFGAAALPRLVGALGLVWLAFWRATLRRVAAARLASTIPTSAPAAGAGAGAGGKGRPAATPWRRLAAHPAVWAIVINNFTFHYAFYLVMNWLPTYFDKVLRADLGATGAVKTLPYLTMFAASNAGGWAGDWLGARAGSVAAGRKAVNTAGFWAAAGALLLMPGAAGVGGGVLCTTLALGACGFARGGFSVNHMDIAPRFAGVVM